MRFRTDGGVHTVKFSRHLRVLLGLGLCALVVAYCVSVDSAVLDIKCHSDDCTLTRNSRPTHALGGLLGRTSSASTNAFSIDEFEALHVKYVEQEPHYRLFLHLRNGRTVLPVSEHAHEQEAEDLAVRIDASLSQSQVKKQVGEARRDLHIRKELSSADEVLLLVAIACAVCICFSVPVEESVSINSEYGVIGIERCTLAHKLVKLSQALRQLHLPAQVVLLPLSIVRGVGERVLERKGLLGGTLRGYAVELRMREGPGQLLRLGLAYSSRTANDQDIRALQGFIDEGKASWSERVRRQPAGEADREMDLTKGGGDPGGECVVCRDRVSRVAFAPCAHVCCCEICGQSPELRTCPVCRTPISHRIGLYFT
jgi:hypothetical protein